MARKTRQKKDAKDERAKPAASAKKTELEKLVQQEFRRIAQEYRKDRNRHIRSIDALDYDRTRVKRRVAATAAFTERAKQIARPVCADWPGAFTVEEEWIFINAVEQPGYDALAERGHWLCGAAIWMLDRLSEQKQLWSAIALLPKDDGTLDELDTIDVYDLCYSWEVLWGMVYVLRERNADCTGLKPRTEKKLPENASALERWRNRLVRRDFCDDYTAAGLQAQQVPSRIRFQAIMDMIDEEAKDRAVRRFEEALWEWVRRYFQCRDRYARQEKVFFDRYQRFKSRFLLELEDLERREEEQKKNAQVRMLLRDPLKGATGEPMALDRQRLAMESMLKAEKYGEEEEALQEKIDGLLFEGCSYAMMPREQVERIACREVADALEGFTVEDPYEMCFALLCLFERGSDLPWLYYPGLCVMKIVEAMLPWHWGEFEEETDRRRSVYNVQRNPNVLPPDVRKHVLAQIPKKYRAPELKDWYRLQYLDERDDPDERTWANLAQVAYQLTGCIMPRNLHRYDFAMYELEQYGITGKKVQIPMLYCLNLMAQARGQHSDWRMLKSYLTEEPEEEQAEAAEEVSVDTLREKLQAQRKELEGLKKRAYEAERTGRELQKKQEEQALDWERERQELYDLRELVFNRSQGSFDEEAPSEEPTEDITYPYQARQRIVVFGGHESWAKQIKPLLPNVRFIDRGAAPNASLIRHADVLWIQANALSHKKYYAITGEARKHRIPIRYFTYSSARRCAEQLVRSDMELE